MNGRFSAMIRDARRTRDLSQIQVCNGVAQASGKKVKVAQSTISGWESGRQLPEDNDKTLRLVAEVLGLDMKEVAPALAQQKLAERPPASGLTSDEFFKAAQDYIDEVGPAGLSLWLLGTDTLPVANNPKVAEIWARNIRKGVHYRIVWCLDMVRADTFGKLAATLHRIEKSVEASPEEGPDDKTHVGRIVHYPFSLYASSTTPASEDGMPAAANHERNLKTYEQLAVAAARLPLNDFKPAVRQQVDEWLRRDIQRYWASFGSVVLYAPRDIYKPPAASLVLQGVRSSLAADAPGAPYYWLSEQATYDLKRVIEAFQASFEGPLSSFGANQNEAPAAAATSRPSGVNTSSPSLT